MVDRFVFDLRIMTAGEASNLSLREIDHWAYRLFLRMSNKKRAI